MRLPDQNDYNIRIILVYYNINNYIVYQRKHLKQFQINLIKFKMFIIML